MSNPNDESQVNPYQSPKVEARKDAVATGERGNALKAGFLLVLSLACLFGAVIAAMGAMAAGFELLSAIATVIFFVASISCSIAGVRYL